MSVQSSIPIHFQKKNNNRQMNLKAFSVFVGLLSLATAASARVCMVYDFDTRGCRAGDDLLYMPRSFGNEQLPIEFIGKKCNMDKPIALTKGGVACTYAGPKNIVEGAEEFSRSVYRSTFEGARADKKRWTQMDNGEYWRVLSRAEYFLESGTGEKIGKGDRVELFYAACLHDKDGAHHRENIYKPDTVINGITENHYVWMAGPLLEGTIVEVVGPTRHAFVGVKKKGSPKPSKSTKSGKI